MFEGLSRILKATRYFHPKDVRRGRGLKGVEEGVRGEGGGVTLPWEFKSFLRGDVPIGRNKKKKKN